MLWMILTAMMAAAVSWLTAPLLRQRGKDARVAGCELEVYRDQLVEVEREKSDGVIDGDQADAACNEVKRRLLAAERDRHAGDYTLSLAQRHLTIACISAIVAIGGSGLYSVLGRPDLPSVSHEATTLVLGDRVQSPAFRPAVSRGTTAGVAAARYDLAATPATDQKQMPTASAQAVGGLGSVDDMIQRLIVRLARDPDNFETWRMLGWSYFATERYAQAADAYRRATELQPDSATLLSSYGEALVLAAQGEVKPEAVAIFDRALASDAKEPRARYFRGLARKQSGDETGALEAWIVLLGESAADDDWAGELRSKIVDLATELGTDVSSRLRPVASAASAPVEGGVLQALKSRDTGMGAQVSSIPARGPSAQAIDAAAAMSPADRQAMIAGMVDGLAERLEKSPQDVDGWIRLIRGRLVLGDPGAARIAFDKGTAAFADRPADLANLTAAALELGVLN